MSNTVLIEELGKQHFSTILADPPWQFRNRTARVSPEFKKLFRYSTVELQEIKDLPVEAIAEDRAHLYLWVPNALVSEGLQVMNAWGFSYKTNIIWYKTRKDGGSDCSGMGFYFRNVTEMLLFGTRGKHVRTLDPGRTQPNVLLSRKHGHSIKPVEQYDLIESCSWGPFLELFARKIRSNWTSWGDQLEK